MAQQGVRRSARLRTTAKKINYLELNEGSSQDNDEEEEDVVVIKPTTPKKKKKVTKKAKKVVLLDLASDSDESAPISKATVKKRKKTTKSPKKRTTTSAAATAASKKRKTSVGTVGAKKAVTPKKSGKRSQPSSSSSSSASSSSSPSKAKKQKKAPKAPKEKRGARWRSQSQKVRDRIARAVRQRLFMINQEEISPLHRKYAVLGSTGNCYYINICNQPDCSCPDFLKGNTCKHILFTFLKVLKVSRHSELIYQKGLLSTELEEIFENAPPNIRAANGNVLASKDVRKKFAKATGHEEDEDEEDEDDEVKQKKLDGSDCAICCEPMKKKDKDKVVFCKAQCGNNIHAECFSMWGNQQRGQGNDVTCVYCRAVWQGNASQAGSTPGGGGVGGPKMNEGYQNFAEEQGMSLTRDTSDYRSSGWGYRRGYGYW